MVSSQTNVISGTIRTQVKLSKEDGYLNLEPQVEVRARGEDVEAIDM